MIFWNKVIDFFSFSHIEEWGVGEAVVKFFLGMVLLGLFGLLWIGIERFSFFFGEGNAPTVTKIDLTKDGLTKNEGYLEITGYPGIQVSRDSSNGVVYMENLAEAAKTGKSFYFSLHDKPNSTTSSVIVLKREVFSGLFGHYWKSDQEKFPSPPEKGKKITVKGVAGYYKEDVDDELKYFFATKSVTLPEKVILLHEGTTPSTIKRTLLWFIPALLGFCLGVYLLIQSTYYMLNF